MRLRSLADFFTQIVLRTTSHNPDVMSNSYRGEKSKFIILSSKLFHMESEKSCGAIIFKKEDNKILYLIIKHKGEGHWGFPKGHVENNETEKETAKREIYEEVGLKVNFLENFRESLSYINHMKNTKKTVVFFLCEATSDKVEYVFDELEDHKWLMFNDAVKNLTHENSISLLEKASDCLKKLSPI